MRSTMEADDVRSAAHGGTREARVDRPADTAEEKAARPRLTLRHLHSLIEALREEHLKLEMRVDRLSSLVDRLAEPDAGARRESALIGDRITESRLAMPELPTGREEAGGRGAGQSAAAEDRAAFGFAIWAGVERAIGNAAVMLAAGRDTESGVADSDPQTERADAKPAPAALFRRQRPPAHEQHEVPIEHLLHELREAARIADEIAANASADYRANPAHPPRAPDLSGGGASGGDAEAGPASSAPEPGASGTADAGPQARDASADTPRLAGAEAAAAAPDPSAESAASGHRGPVTAQPPDAPAGAPPQTSQRQPAADMPSITIPRSERHRVRKKPSLWTRLFGRQHA